MNFIKIKVPFLILSMIILNSCSSDNLESRTDENSPNFDIEINPLDPIEIEVLENINEFRVSNGLTLLGEMEIIRPQAYAHTKKMISDNKMSHDNFVEREQYLAQNANAKSVSEVVAFGYNNAKDVVDAWLKSESHRKSLEGNFTHFNISAEKDNRGLYYFTCIFVKS